MTALQKGQGYVWPVLIEMSPKDLVRNDPSEDRSQRTVAPYFTVRGELRQESRVLLGPVEPPGQ